MKDRRSADVDEHQRREQSAFREFARELLLELATSLVVAGLLAGLTVCVWSLWGVAPVLGIAGAVVILAGLSGGVARLLFTGPWSARRFLKGLATVVVYGVASLLG